jgi:hypothetical protein
MPKTSCAFFGSSSWDVLHFGSSSCDFLHFWRNSQDVFEILHRIFWKFFVGFSAFLEVPHGIV